MNIFSDFHHSGLYYSLYLTLEKRLGHQLYRPIGMEWFDRGFWDIGKPYGAGAVDTAKQYLEQGSIPKDGTAPLNSDMLKQDHCYYIAEIPHEYLQKGITIQQFAAMDIDVIIASIPDHVATYKRLRDLYHPKAKLVFQMGNMFNEIKTMIADGSVTNLMASTIDFSVPGSVNACFYYQEIPLVDFVKIPEIPSIKSFVHLLPRPELYQQYRKELEIYFQFRAHGASTPDGNIDGIKNVYKEMQSASFIYHVKPGGDGFGWNWHSAFMVGRPVLTNFSDYKDKLGGLMFEHMRTGVDLERGTVQENCNLLRKIALVETLPKMAWEAQNRFREIVDYNSEAEKIRVFLENLN